MNVSKSVGVALWTTKLSSTRLSEKGLDRPCALVD